MMIMVIKKINTMTIMKHAHGEHDPHIWLDPMNAKVILKKWQNQLKTIKKMHLNIKLI